MKTALLLSTLLTSALTAQTANSNVFGNNYHIGFERPEAWGLKYFTSTTLLSGLQPPERAEGHRVGAMSVGFEMGWIPSLDEGQRRVGFNGKAVQDLNQSPFFARPVVRIGLPGKFTAVAAAPPPFHLLGITAHLLAFGLERPILQHDRWTLSWRGYGQVGTIKGAFTCPTAVLAFAPGSPENPTSCVGKSSDVATVRYAGSEFQFAYKIAGMPKLVPHVATGGNFMDGAFQTDAPVVRGRDRTRLWTRGGTWSSTVGASYLLTAKTAFTVDAFYTPLWVKRNPTAPRTNDGLFNVRALLSYSFR
ncbi:MAG: hypothetical protein JWP63_5367 [Candidatus Solibacter sp.]|nr:hypothetical protein [Candidatus Solibacter sp.]